MQCSDCKSNESKEIVIGGITVDRCSLCGGFWFESDELRKVKDEKVEYARWFDFDLWDKPSLFRAKEATRLCPSDGTNLFTLKYGDSDIEIDACKKCHGIWLDAGEFEKILEYVRKESNTELLKSYTKNLLAEEKEVFTGPEGVKSELADLLLVLKMFRYKFMVQHPGLTGILMSV